MSTATERVSTRTMEATGLPAPGQPGITISDGLAKQLDMFGLSADDIFTAFRRIELSAEDTRKLEARRHFFYGSYLLEIEQPAHALAEFRAALEADPGNNDIMLGVAEAQIESRSLDSAQKTLDEILGKDPQNITALIQKAKVLVSRAEDATGEARRNFVDQAIKTFTSARELQPKNMEVLQGLASAYFAQQNVANIVQAYKDILAVNPKDTRAVLVLANVLQRTGHQQEAVQFFEQVVEQRRGFINGYIYLAQIYEELGRTNDAVETLKKAILIEPRNEQLLQKFESVVEKLAGGKSQKGAIRFYENFAKEYPYSSEIQKLYGDQLLQSQDADGAIRQYKRVLQLDPENQDTLIAIGKMFLGQQNFAEAVKYFSKAVELNPEQVEVYDALALGLLGQKNRAKALEVYRDAIKLNSKATRLYISLAALFEQDGKSAEAIQVLNDGLSSAGPKADLYTALGALLEKAGRSDEALEKFQRAYTETPSDPVLFAKLVTLLIKKNDPSALQSVLTRGLEAFKGRKAQFYAIVGEVYHSLARLPEAAEYYEKALGEQADEPLVVERLVVIYNTQKQYDKSIALLEKSKSLARTGKTTTLLLAETYLQNKDFAKGLEMSRAFLAQNPDSIDAYRYLIDALNKAGKPQEAIAAAKEAETKLGRSEDARMMLAVAYYQQKNYADAEKILKDLARQKGKSQDVVYYYLGSLNLDQRRYEQAETAFRASIDANPANDNSLNALGYMLADRNMKLDEAQKFIEQALELKPNAPHILDSLGWVYFRKGQNEKALEQIQKALALTGEDPEILEHLGDIWAAMGNAEKASEVYKQSYELDPKRPGVKEKYESASRKLK
ncbi:MAG: tetratricopeptide repeat protein [Candidatus Sumerlaeaceae bacterium]|nr:tetratricopeptide repeat protein [Candidatus Sumerlaeaceae bacterium]